MGRLARTRHIGGRAALAAALALAIAVSAFAAPPVALADGPGVTVTDIVTPDSGGIAVGLADGRALWVKATILASTAPGAATLFSTDDLQFRDDRGWFTDDAIQLPGGAPFGDYPVDVDYRLETGTVQHWSGAAHGTDALFHYRRHLSVDDVSFDRTATDFDHPTVTLSGTVDSFDPSAGTTEPAGAGVPVHVAWTSISGERSTLRGATTVTQADGSFAAPITPNGLLSSGTAMVINPSADSAADDAVPVPDVGVNAIRVRIVGTPSSARAHAGSRVLVSGTVQRLTDRGWQPLVGADVVSTSRAPDYYNYTTRGLLGSGTSDRNGHYSYRIKASRTSGLETYVHFSEYVSKDSEQDTQLFVPTRTALSALTYSIDQFRQVQIRGKLHGNCSAQALTLQRSANGRTGWTKIGSGVTSENYDGRPCSFSLTAFGGADGHYRIAHAESDQSLAFTSPSRRLHRIATRIQSFAMSPAHPSGSSTLVATGRTTQQSRRSWTGLKDVAIALVFRPKGNSTWYRVTKARTTASGGFTISTKNPASYFGDGDWAVFYSADSRHFYSQSVVRSVNVG